MTAKDINITEPACVSDHVMTLEYIGVSDRCHLKLIDNSDGDRAISSFWLDVSPDRDKAMLYSVRTVDDRQHQGCMNQLFGFMMRHLYTIFDGNNAVIRLNTRNSPKNKAFKLYRKFGFWPVEPHSNLMYLKLVNYDTAMERIEWFLRASGIRMLCEQHCKGRCCGNCRDNNRYSCKNVGRKLGCSTFLCHAVYNHIIRARECDYDNQAHEYVWEVHDNHFIQGSIYYRDIDHKFKKILWDVNRLWPFFDEHIDVDCIRERVNQTVAGPPGWLRDKAVRRD